MQKQHVFLLGLEWNDAKAQKTAKDAYVGSLNDIAEPDGNDLQNRKLSKIVGGDPIPYSLDEAYNGIETFIKFNVDQKIIPDYVGPETLFEMPT